MTLFEDFSRESLASGCPVPFHEKGSFELQRSELGVLKVIQGVHLCLSVHRLATLAEVHKEKLPSSPKERAPQECDRVGCRFFDSESDGMSFLGKVFGLQPWYGRINKCSDGVPQPAEWTSKPSCAQTTWLSLCRKRGDFFHPSPL